MLRGPADSRLRDALGRDRKGKLSFGLSIAAVVLAFVIPWIAVAIYVAFAALWLIPDRRIEGRL